MHVIHFTGSRLNKLKELKIKKKRKKILLLKSVWLVNVQVINIFVDDTIFSFDEYT